MNPAVLIVDDEQSICSALQRTFRKENFRVLSANSGEEALTLLKNNDIDVIVSDQKMPGMTGTQLLSVVKDKHPNIGRIILSGHSDTHDLSEAINEANINKFLTKPWDEKSLITTVRTTLQDTASTASSISSIITAKAQPTPTYKPSKAMTDLINETYQISLEKDIKSDRLLLNKAQFQMKTKNHLPISTYHTLWPAFSNFNHEGIVNMAHQSGYLSELFLWYLININASLEHSHKEDRIIDLFFEPFANKRLLQQQLLKLLRTRSHLIFRVSFENIRKESFNNILPDIYKNNHSILLNLGKRVIDIRELAALPVQHIELDCKYSSISNSMLTEKRINMLNDAQNMGIKTILSLSQSKIQHDYAVSMGFDYF